MKQTLPGSRQDKTGTDGEGGRVIKCELCGKDHHTYKCDNLKPENVNLENVKDTLKKRNICYRCLRVRERNHKEHCHFEYYYFEDGEKKKGCSDCRRCSAGGKYVHHKICEHAADRAKNAQENKTSSRKMSTQRSEAIRREIEESGFDRDDFEDTEENIVGKPPGTSSQKFEARACGFKQNLINGVGLGATICPAEILEVQKHDGKPQKIVCLYDGCGQNSSVHEAFAKELKLKRRRLPHTLKTSTGEKQMPRGQVYDIKIRGSEGQEWQTVQALGAPALGEIYDEVNVPVAKEFIDEHPEILEQDGALNRPAGLMVVLLGQDALPHFPREIMESKCEKQRLSKSKFTGRYLVQGVPDIVAARAEAYRGNTKYPKKVDGELEETKHTEADEDGDEFDDLEDKIRRSIVVNEGCDLVTRIERRSYKETENILQDFDYTNLPHVVPAKCHSCRSCDRCKPVSYTHLTLPTKA